MPLHKFECPRCGQTLEDNLPHGQGCFVHLPCGSPMDILWSAAHQRDTVVHPSERAVVWENPATGEIRYPGRNDRPIPTYYAKLGYQRKEFTSLRELDRFCKTKNLVNEHANYDRNGRSYDEER